MQCWCIQGVEGWQGALENKPKHWIVGLDCLQVCRRRVMLASQTWSMSPASGQTQVISVGHCIVCILQAVKEGEVMEQV